MVEESGEFENPFTSICHANHYVCYLKKYFKLKSWPAAQAGPQKVTNLA